MLISAYFGSIAALPLDPIGEAWSDAMFWSDGTGWID